LINKI